MDRQRLLDRFLKNPLRWGWIALATVTVVAVAVSTILVKLVDETNFKDYGDATWWAIQTITTVGYGDVVPTTGAGRVIGAIVMVVGLSFITVATALLTAAVIETVRRRRFTALEDPVMTEIKELRAELAELRELLGRD